MIWELGIQFKLRETNDPYFMFTALVFKRSILQGAIVVCKQGSLSATVS